MQSVTNTFLVISLCENVDKKIRPHGHSADKTFYVIVNEDYVRDCGTDFLNLLIIKHTLTAMVPWAP